MIKNELRAIGQKVRGKKANLIDRLLSNASPEELEKKFSVRFYELTESGTQELTENQYVPYLHCYKYMSIWDFECAFLIPFEVDHIEHLTFIFLGNSQPGYRVFFSR